MRRIEVKLTAWDRLHGELENARLHLRGTSSRCGQDDLEAEVHRLVREGDAARDAVYAAMASFKDSPDVSAADDGSPRAPCRQSPASFRFVRFYEEDRFLLAEVARYIGAALRAGHTGIVIARSALRRELTVKLEREQARGRPTDRGDFVALDAQETLDKFMVQGWPHEGMFHHVVGELVERSTSGGKKVAAFAEMVPLLCEQGNFEAAARLENLWNGLLGRCRFSLLCAYPARLFKSVSGKPSCMRLGDARREVLQA